MAALDAGLPSEVVCHFNKVLNMHHAVTDCYRDLHHLKLLCDAALRDGKLLGLTWRPQETSGSSKWAASSAKCRELGVERACRNIPCYTRGSCANFIHSRAGTVK
jgi:hypothetical protein